jgi:signal transduction histidine kinase/purine-cytosine permease-like protein/DNA-binding NarL/FixJ family response regulator
MSATQRIVRVRRQYNQWVADRSLEDYALRFTGRVARRWSHFRVANTAIGSISFLALEAIGGLITLQYGFTNAICAIAVVSTLIFLSSLAIAYYAANYGLDIDLLTRGAGFGYLGSALSSLIYAIFTFVFFAIEASIMAVALEMGLGIPLQVGYALSSLIIIPLVAYGITLISRLQSWTQPVWAVLQLLPFLALAVVAPDNFRHWVEYTGVDGMKPGFSFVLFGAAASVIFSLMGQIGEQADFLRFMPPRDRSRFDWRWWSAMLIGGPGWIVVGALKMIAGSILAVVAMRHGLTPQYAAEPVEMYRVGFSYLFGSNHLVVAATVLFVTLSQIKINVTNAYAGSIAWSNFFARLTHSHPGRVIWLVFNVAIALLIMQLGVYRALGSILAIYSNLAVAWIGALVADLVINKPLGLSPPGIEFKRAYLPGANPVGSGAMTLASLLALLAFSGVLGEDMEALSGFIGLLTAFAVTPILAYATRGRYYLAREPDPSPPESIHRTCCICEHTFDAEDMASCPAYDGPICSLCCTLDARCGDRCKPGHNLTEQIAVMLKDIAPQKAAGVALERFARYAVVFLSLTLTIAGVVAFVHVQTVIEDGNRADVIYSMSVHTFWTFAIVGAVSAWMIVLARESRTLAQEESERQTTLLMEEIEAHTRTDAALQSSNAELQKAKDVAEAANLAKSRYMIGISHELRSPLNAVLGYGQILTNDSSIPRHRKNAIDVVRRSAEHMSGLVDGLLDISKIESGQLYLHREELHLRDVLEQLADMFRLQAKTKGLDFHFEILDQLPQAVYGDGRRLRQIVINLLSNAVKYTQRGRVSFRVRYRNMFAEIEVSDTGFGVRAEDQVRIFEPFERGQQPNGAAVPGTGLGLTITRMLVQVMGGEINLISKPGEGSTFKVRLMLSEVTYPSASPKPHADLRGYQGRRRSIVVADDDRTHCAILTEVLGPLGFSVVVVDSGVACLEVARQHRPDLVLLDVSMPGMSGWDVATELRERVSPATRIVMLSGSAFEIDAHRDVVKHYDAVHTKPFYIGSLLQTIADLLDLEWIVDRETESSGDDEASSNETAGIGPVDRKLPDLRELMDLRRLGEIGYVRGIREKLSDMASQSQDYRWLVDQLEPLSRDLDFPQYIVVLSELIEQELET